jgi:hypothetical protein
MVKNEILKKCRNILYNRLTGYPLNSSDCEFLMSIFPLHPRYTEKINGRTIKNIIIKYHPKYHNKCFALVFTDNTNTEISFTECINRVGLKDSIVEACNKIIPGIDEKIINEWIKTFENQELTLGLYLDLTNKCFNCQAAVDSFTNFVIEKTQSIEPQNLIHE